LNHRDHRAHRDFSWASTLGDLVRLRLYLRVLFFLCVLCVFRFKVWVFRFEVKV